jgi:hypothetical protein
MPQDPKTIGIPSARPDETPATFAELKPPGYWSATLGYFVPVRVVSDDEFWSRSFLADPEFCEALAAQCRLPQD